MSLRVVASADERARAIRDHILPVLRQRGVLEIQRDTVRLIELRTDGWIFQHWTPFNDLPAEAAASPGYRHAIERQRGQPDLPYGLDISHGMSVMRVLWADDGTFKVVRFIRGPWEDEALAL